MAQWLEELVALAEEPDSTKSKESVRAPGTEAMGGCEPPHGPGNRTQVLYKSTKCFLTTEPILQYPDLVLLLTSPPGYQ